VIVDEKENLLYDHFSERVVCRITRRGNV